VSFRYAGSWTVCDSRAARVPRTGRPCQSHWKSAGYCNRNMSCPPIYSRKPCLALEGEFCCYTVEEVRVYIIQWGCILYSEGVYYTVRVYIMQWGCILCSEGVYYTVRVYIIQWEYILYSVGVYYTVKEYADRTRSRTQVRWVTRSAAFNSSHSPRHTDLPQARTVKLTHSLLFCPSVSLSVCHTGPTCRRLCWVLGLFSVHELLLPFTMFL